ncbi:hypothetical protein THAOC_24786, partial [Thalassiosira oceanica]
MSQDRKNETRHGHGHALDIFEGDAFGETTKDFRPAALGPAVRKARSSTRAWPQVAVAAAALAALASALASGKRSGKQNGRRASGAECIVAGSEQGGGRGGAEEARHAKAPKGAVQSHSKPQNQGP